MREITGDDAENVETTEEVEVLPRKTVVDHINDVITDLQTDGVTPEELFEMVKADENHPLRHRFTWDTDEAAYKYNIIEARTILRQVLLIQAGGTETMRAFVPVEVVANRREYVPTNVALGNAVGRAQLFNRYRSTLRGYRAALSAFEEFSPVVAAIEELEELSTDVE
jgi:hypothetical protein|tara:strand:+ start:846 stop:1349 length:504 start_codon:yes stop_codon:yes gene_type:complete